MNCIYCNQLCKQFAPYSIRYKCISCKTNFYIYDNQMNSIDIEYKDENRTYLVNLLMYSNTSVVSYTISNSNIVILAEVNRILNITPQNIKEKIKLYMVFS